MRSRTLFILLLLLLNHLSGQNFYALIYNEGSGLPSDIVRDAALDTFGFLWIATDNGLSRFDGTNFQHYRQQLPSQYGRYLCPTGDGFLYTHDAGLSLIQPGLDTSRVQLLMAGSIDPENDNLLYYPDQVFQMKNGNIWISQPNGTIKCLSDGQIRTYRVETAGSERTKVQTFFAETEDGHFWLATNRGALFAYDQQRDSLLPLAQLGKINTLRAVGPDCWAGGDYLYQLTPTADGRKIKKKEQYRCPQGPVTALEFDNRRNLYLGIAGRGLYLFDLRPGQPPAFIRIFGNNDPHRIDELPFRNIHNLSWNARNQLLVCSSEGLGILQKRFFESVGGLPNGNTTSIAVAPSGKVFINFGDIYVATPTEFGFEASSMPNLRQGSISAITATGGQLWAGTSTGRLLRLTESGRLLQTVDLSERGEGIFYLIPDQLKRLWFCQAPSEKPIVGVGCLLPDGRIKEYGPAAGLENRILVVKETAQGRIYAGGIGVGTYLYRYLPEEDAFVNLSIPFDFYVSPNFEVHDLTVDERGVVWLASTDGLLRYDMDRIRQVDLGPEFTGIEIRAVANLPDGSVWMATDTEGILRYQDDSHLVIREESGLPTKVMAYRSLVKDAESRLWVGSAEGVVFSLHPQPSPERTPSPWLQGIFVDGARLDTAELNIFHRQSLEFQVICPAYHGYRTFYRYRLDSGDWSPPQTAQHIRIEDLTPGKYTLLISARQEGSKRWSDPLILRIQVSSYWYENRWLQLGAAATSIIFLWWLYRYRKIKYLRYINILNRRLQTDQKEIARREADLAKAKAKIQSEQRELRMNLLSLELLRRLISKIPPGMQWEDMLEVLAVDLIKIPGITAFELGLVNQETIDIQGYSEHVKGFTSARTVRNPQSSLTAYGMEHGHPLILGDIRKDAGEQLSNYDHRHDGYQSAMLVPFRWEGRPAVLCLYSDVTHFFDDYNVRAMELFTTYLEQIT